MRFLKDFGNRNRPVPLGTIVVWMIIGAGVGILIGTPRHNDIVFGFVGSFVGLLLGFYVARLSESLRVVVPWSGYVIAALIIILLFDNIGIAPALAFAFLASFALVPAMEASSRLATAYGMSDKAPWIEAGMIVAPIIIMAGFVGAQLCRKTLTERARWAWINALVLILGMPLVIIFAFYQLSRWWR